MGCENIQILGYTYEFRHLIKSKEKLKIVFFFQNAFQNKHNASVGVTQLFKQHTSENTQKAKLQCVTRVHSWFLSKQECYSKY